MKVLIEKISNGTHYGDIPTRVAEGWIKKGSKRLRCTLNGKVTFHCALNRRKEGAYFIYFSKEALKKADLRLGQYVEVSLADDKTKHQFATPQEWQEVILTCPR